MLKLTKRQKLRKKLRPYSAFQQSKYKSQLINYINREYKHLERIPSTKYDELI